MRPRFAKLKFHTFDFGGASMDYGAIAAALVAVVGPLLGKALSTGGESAVEAVGEKLGEGLFERAKALLAKLRPKVEAKPGAPEAARELAGHPDDPDARTEMALHLKRIFAADPALAAEVEALLGQTAAGGSMIGKATGGGVVAQAGAAGAADGGVALVGPFFGNVHLETRGKQGADPGESLDAKYLGYLFHEVGRVELAKVDKSIDRADPLAGFELQAVYTALLTKTQCAQADRADRAHEAFSGREERALSALELLDRSPRLVLLGEPGSGKSTFVHFVALCQAGEQLGRTEANRAVLTTALPDEEKEQPWRHRALVPVRVILRDFAVDGLPAPGERATAGHLWNFIAGDLAVQGLAAYAERLESRLRAEGGLVLLDGLDEVPDAEGRRQQIREAIERFAGQYLKCRFLVTSRTYAYRNQGWRLDGFDEAELAPFSEAQIALFVRRWYEHAASRGRGSAEDAVARADLLLQEIRAKPRLREFAERPLLLTLMASLARSGVRGLPDRRAKLYAQVVDLLLDVWECGRYQLQEDGKVRQLQPSLSDWLKTDRDAVRRLLEDLAFDAHAAQEGSEGTADIPQKELVDRLVSVAGSGEVSQARLVEFLSERSGILVARGVGVWALPHRTFQEYLAACHLTSGSFPYEVADLGRADPDRWREVVLLAAAKSEEGTVAGVWSLAQSLCRADPDSCTVSGEEAWGARLAGLVLEESPRALPERRPEHREILDRTVAWHLRLIRDEGFSPAERAAAGRTLAALGDPRFDPERWFLPKDDPLLGFVEIREGEFSMGSDPARDDQAYPDEKPEHRLSLLAFYMARWPVTVGQFAVFALATGHEGVPAEYLSRPGNEPMVAVSWPDALAYAVWLGEKLRVEAEKKEASGWGEEAGKIAFWRGLASGELSVSLPSEAEWEKAARGEDGRIYPWEGPYAAGRANDREAGTGGPSTVGCFPGGASPYGVEELSGNVWEWTRSVWGPEIEKPEFGYPYVANDGRENLESPARRVLRGGAFYDEPWLVRCAVRLRYEPAARVVDSGFRVVVSPFRSEP
jgi:formylglycine-generating enzyme required for sulfatase activity